MKKKTTQSKVPTAQDRPLFEQAWRLMEEDLVDADHERAARTLLSKLRRNSYEFSDSDLFDDRCLACLDLALHSAACLDKNAMPLDSSFRQPNPQLN